MHCDRRVGVKGAEQCNLVGCHKQSAKLHARRWYKDVSIEVWVDRYKVLQEALQRREVTSFFRVPFIIVSSLVHGSTALQMDRSIFYHLFEYYRY